MRVTFDSQSDTLHRALRDGVAITESDEAAPGVILDYDAGGNLVSLEVLDASRRVTDARHVDFQTVG